MAAPLSGLDLEESFFPTTAAMWQRWLPWLRLFRGFRIAINPRAMLLALMAVFLWSAGEWFINTSLLPTSRQTGSQQNIPIPPRTVWPWQQRGAVLPQQLPLTSTITFDGESLMLESPQISQEAPLRLTDPMWRVLSPAFRVLVRSTKNVSSVQPISLWILGAIISAVFGGAIARMAAVDFAIHQDISLTRAAWFSTRRWASSLGAPLIALLGFAVCWLLNFFGGLLANIPVLGPMLAGLFWFLLIMSGFAMAFILLLIGLGWPLMIAAVNTESSDAFDSLSRSCSYLLNRPWYAIFLVALALLYGTILLMFVKSMVEFTAHMTVIPYEAGYVDDALPPQYRRPEAIWPPLDNFLGGQQRTISPGEPGATLRLFWTRILQSVPAAFVFSFFWTMVTIIYFLLRKREDATPLNEVWMPASGTGPVLPLVGIPAAELREQQRTDSTSGPESTSP